MRGGCGTRIGVVLVFFLYHASTAIVQRFLLSPMGIFLLGFVSDYLSLYLPFQARVLLP